MLKPHFKNVFQKNVSITLCIFGVETVGQVPIRGVLWVRTQDFSFRMIGYIRKLGVSIPVYNQERIAGGCFYALPGVYNVKTTL